MEQPATPSAPGDDRARRRGLFPSRDQGAQDDVLLGAARRVEELMASYQATIQRQLDEGLRRIQLTASSLMHEIASEVWRTAGGDKDQTRAQILHELSRDQALRSLIAHADERFQALAVRTAGLEDTLNHVAESVRAARQQLTERAGLLGADGAQQDARTNELREQLAEVTRQVAAALGTLTERDQAIVDTVRTRVREHGELITQETTRISAALQAYVQQGVEAVGQLAGSVDARMQSLAGDVEAQIQAIAARDSEVADRIARTVEEQMTLLGEQVQLMYDRMSLETSSITEALAHQAERGDDRTRAVGEYLHLLNERIDVASRESREEMRRTLEARVMGLAQLVRSDAEALRGELIRTTGTLDERLTQALDERISAVTGAVIEGATRMVEGFEHQMQEETAGAVRAWIDEALARLETHADEQSRRFDGRTEEALSAIDRNMVRLTDAIEVQFERLGRTVGEGAGRAAEVAIDERFEGVLTQLRNATGTIDRIQGTVEDARDRIHGTVEDARDRIEQAVDRSVEARISALARLIRSDNETIAEQLVADQEASKQSLRAMKELQASLPGEVTQMVEQRFASLAESIERSNEMLAKRIDRMAVKIGERYDNDIQVVVDRMGDAMHALASLGRPGETGGTTRTAEPRIELE